MSKSVEGCAAFSPKVGGHFRVADGVRPFHGGHPRGILEVSGCGEAREVPLEVVLMPAGLVLGAVYEESIDLHGSFFTPLKKTSDILKASDDFFEGP